MNETPVASRWAKRIGLIAGPSVAVLVYFLLPEQYRSESGQVIAFTNAGRATLAVMAWMGIWWLTEAIEISATALLPLALFPILGIATMSQAASPYANEIIFLFMGGFILALSMQRWGLDKRIALITLRMVGTRPPAMIGGFMLATAVMSMWVSNTATAAMMLPIALSVIDLVLKRHNGATTRSEADGGADAQQVSGQHSTLTSPSTSFQVMAPEAPGRNFALSLMLGIAYAASIGGIATIIGSPPNGILVQYMADSLGREISFVEWMAIGGPVTLVFLPVAWALITWILYPIRIKQIEGGRELIDHELRALGRMKAGEWVTFIVFMVTASCWIFRPLLTQIEVPVDGQSIRPLAGLSDGGIAMLAALALFVIPVRPQGSRAMTFTMNWQTAQRLPWGILILFGGGLSLAAAVKANGVAEYFASLAVVLSDAPILVLIVAVTAGVIFLTELTSNTATTATLVPVLAGLAAGLDMAPEMLIIPATIAASCAFMMPVATPPNAIVFGSGYVTIPQMCKAGVWLNLAGIVIITTVLYAIVLPLLGV